MSEQQDRVLRAMTDDGSFRVLVAETTATVRAIATAQSVPAHSLDESAGITTAAVLVRETMAPMNRVQVIYQDPIGSQLVGDAFPEGKTRGLARIQDDVLGVRVAEGGSLQVERMIRAGRMHQGIVGTETDEDLVDTLRRYFLQSEQVTSMVDLGSVVEGGEVKSAAGYVIQLLPEVTDPPLHAMQMRLERFGRLGPYLAARGADARAILTALLEGVKYTMLADSQVVFHCPCDRDRVLGAAAALGRDDIRDLLAKEEELEVTCDYCREKYTLGVRDYHALLEGLGD